MTIQSTRGDNEHIPCVIVEGEDVICLQGGGGTSRNVHGNGWKKDVAFTLNTVDVHGVMYEVDRNDSRPSNAKGD